MLQNEVLKLISDQCVAWSLAKQNYADLSLVKQRIIKLGDLPFHLQFNPARMVSSAAKTDKESIVKRACFLCAQNRPNQQKGIKLNMNHDNCHTYDILVNPFPIFKKHITIVDENHVDQRIQGRVKDMLELATQLTQFTLFYNGANCGASAPDHFHFQACLKGSIPSEEIEANKQFFNLHELSASSSVWISNKEYMRSCIVLKSDCIDEIVNLFDKLYAYFISNGSTEEPMMNILCSVESNQSYKLVVFPRKAQRPREFYAEGSEQIVISPASVEMGGKLVLPRAEDFDKLNETHIKSVYEQVSLVINESQFISFLKS